MKSALAVTPGHPPPQLTPRRLPLPHGDASGQAGSQFILMLLCIYTHIRIYFVLFVLSRVANCTPRHLEIKSLCISYIDPINELHLDERTCAITVLTSMINDCNTPKSGHVQNVIQTDTYFIRESIHIYAWAGLCVLINVYIYRTYYLCVCLKFICLFC